MADQSQFAASTRTPGESHPSVPDHANETAVAEQAGAEQPKYGTAAGLDRQALQALRNFFELLDQWDREGSDRDR